MISRVSDVTQDGHVVDVYIHSGGVVTYSCVLALIPDYDVVLTVNAAGDSGLIAPNFAEIAIATMLPAVDQVARAQAATDFDGTYISFDGTNTSLTLTVDGGPGLRVK